jgi:TolB protein
MLVFYFLVEWRLADLQTSLASFRGTSVRNQFLLAIVTILALNEHKVRAHDYAVGADLSFLKQAEDRGTVFKDGGRTRPGLEIFKDHGYNWIRLRLFHTPTRLPNNLDYTIALAKQARSQGFKFLLDFHYSDTWADPGKQFIPAAWKAMAHEELVRAVFDYTRTTIQAFREAGVLPDMVQIGNEVIGGMLWPDGKLPEHWDQFAALVKAGIQGVEAGRAQGTRPRIMIHIDRGGDQRGTKAFFDKLHTYNVEYDVIGQSYYPWWHGSLQDLRENLDFMARTYDKDIMLVEAAYCWRPTEYKGKKAGPFAESPDGQKAFLEEVNRIVLETPNHRGIGIFWWEPAVSGPLRNRGFFDDDGTALPVMGVFDHFPFEARGDVGSVLHPGSVTFDRAAGAYTVAGSGENMWFDKDAFQFAWKKASGDVALMADVAFLGAGTDPHRKACLMIRQSLDADSAYVDVALHGDGLTSLQFREAKGAATHEVQANLSAPRRLRIEKRGKYALMFLAPEGKDPRYCGTAARISLESPFYVGIGVCSHNKNVTERAVFSNVEITSPLPQPSGRPVLYSTLETQSISSTDRRVVHVTRGRIEAPNWLKDGRSLIFNRDGRIFRIAAAGGEPQLIDTGFATRCNNDHGPSPDGSTLAISDQTQEKGRSLIYSLPISGGTPRRITQQGPSYWHGWSPDGETLAFCGEREGEFDIYTIPADGGSETRLTTAKGLDDGPEYSPDGKFIYFNSIRSGTMQIWRMRVDGTEQEPVTSDEFNNWFPHLSPDGRQVVFLSYEKDVIGHPENKDVTLRLMTPSTKKIDVLARLFGGQGTINVPCWSPDGRRIAFVTYQLIAD